jgi:hypothetical protein
MPSRAYSHYSGDILGKSRRIKERINGDRHESSRLHRKAFLANDAAAAMNKLLGTFSPRASRSLNPRHQGYHT